MKRVSMLFRSDEQRSVVVSKGGADNDEPFEVCPVPASYAATLDMPPGPKWFVPVIGETLDFFDMTEYIKKRVSKYGLVFQSHLLLKPTIVVGDINILKQLMVKEGKWVISEWPNSVKQLLGPGSVVIKSGAPHKALRKAMQDSTLGKHRTPLYYDLIAAQANKHVKSWMATEGTVVKGYRLTKRAAFAVGYSIVLDFDFTLEEGERVLKITEDFLAGLFALPINLPGTAFNKALKARKQLDKLAQAQLDKFKEKKANAAPKKYQSVTEAILESEGLGLSNQDILDNVVTLLFAATDTTTGTLTSMLLLIAYAQQNTGLLDELREEQKRILEQNPDGIFTKEIIEKELPLLTACYMEALRVINPIQNTFRTAITDIQIGPNMKIPKGYQIVASQRIASFAGKNAEITNQLTRHDWKIDVLEAFNPKLWLNEETKPETMNFGYGVKRCIGYDIVSVEIKIIMSTLLRAGRWELRNGTENKPFKTFPVNVPVDDLDISFINDPIIL